ncbi:nuclear transport factor 2 family protein [uncultured Croceitalea sp.]|uniref:nuclear transport factor 2 family protein n=1 Tax=uncultured Croceitalea sp. TaxID=1798908 RepID=UPI003305C3C9
MKKIKIKWVLFLLVIFSTVVQMNAQNDENKALVEAVTLGYIENFFENNFEQMSLYLHPELAKRGVSKKRGLEEYYFEDLSMEALKNMLTSKKVLSKEDQINKVEVLDIFRNTASVKLTTGYPKRMKWIEYIHLVKVSGEWKIANIIWDYFPMKPRARKN